MKVKSPNTQRVIKLLIFLFVFLLVPLKVKAAIPDPTSIFYVNDFANVLSDKTMNDIIDKNIALEEKSGAQIVVVTVDYADGKSVDDYAGELFNNWEIGSADANNGVLLILFIGEDDYYALQGRGIERVLTGGTLQQVLDDELEPYFAMQQYDEGVEAAFNAFYNILDNYYTKNPAVQKDLGTAPATETSRDTNPAVNQPEPRTENNTNKTGGFPWGFLIFLLLIILIFWPRRGRYYRTYDTPYYPPGGRRYRGWWGGSWYHRPPPPRGPGYGPGPGNPPPRNQGYGSGPANPPPSGGHAGGGGSTRGGGAGQSAFGSWGSSSGAGRTSSSSRPSAPSRPSSPRMGGGGSSRGGGAGRRK